MNRRIAGAAGATAMAVVLVLTGCAGIRSERQGKEIGKSICDLKGADNAQDAQKYVKRIQDDFKDAQRITGVDVNQDVRRIDDNLNDLAKHAGNGSSALAQQDVAAIRRNLSQAISSTSGNVQNFYQGVQEGLDTCSNG